MDTQTDPVAETTEFSATSISDALAGPERHAPQERHTTEREPGVAPEGDGAAMTDAGPAAGPKPAKQTAQPGPKAATPPAGPAGEGPQSDTTTAPKEPKWYRDHMAQVNRERASERAELARTRAESERLRGQGPRPATGGDPQAQALPDPVDDPQGFYDHVQTTFSRRQQEFELKTTLNFSERFARQTHGNEPFEECQAWLSTKPDLADWCVMQLDPWGAAFSQYQRDRLAEEIGDDPNAWREQERARIRAEVEA